MTKLALGPGFPEPVDGLPYRPCVGIMLINKAGKVWIGSRDDGGSSSNYEYCWQMPQGGIDKGEAPEPAARRELYEETSIKSVTLLEEAPEWFAYDYPDEVVRMSRKGKYRGQAQRWIAYRFDGSEDEINILNPPDGHTAEFSNWRWEDADRLPGLIVPFKRPVYERVVAAFSHLTS
ncbi:dinucleoside polyphosphate hydrolase [Roseibium aggregatum IAM 12614]|uniref:RNA pyrophosphohydrolase n=1 Tax=Roseibium aggregatum (strain ATCC 25650 / DSM 13394 / JCM 20685 / NBRC 16684 / NCIMB 2208 / IAM 12614 / B1) TaxID=384765 RepID=A0NRJ4_ROSAI|nr:RNA pyrophosphohydrolase [Roseibium aggregatum]EAV44775.1 dinucleoside polyphosphate hydrolase [Roseibium aggregatum IAM 12614]